MEEPHPIHPDSLPFAPNDLQRFPLTAEQVYHTYAPRIYNTARRMVSNEKDAEDVTQEVFLQVVRKLPTFRGESAFPTWLHRVAVNAALAYRRQRAAREQHRAPEAVLDQQEENRATPGAAAAPPERLVLD